MTHSRFPVWENWIVDDMNLATPFPVADFGGTATD